MAKYLFWAGVVVVWGCLVAAAVECAPLVEWLLNTHF